MRHRRAGDAAGPSCDVPNPDTGDCIPGVEQLYCDEINGEKMANYIKWVDIVAGITLTGHPVVQLPCGLGPTGMPFGLQIVGPRLHSDRFIIAVAAALESYFATEPDLARPVPDFGRIGIST